MFITVLYKVVLMPCMVSYKKKETMITFNKQNDVVSHILNNGVKVGHVEKVVGGYEIEVYYERGFMRKSDYTKTNINNYIRSAINSIEYRITSEQNLIQRGFKILG